jgi:hypothetical protein
MESATVIIFFARLVHFQGERGGCEKEYSLCACDKDGHCKFPERYTADRIFDVSTYLDFISLWTIFLKTVKMDNFI